MSKLKKAIEIFFERGYTIDKNGDIIKPDNTKYVPVTICKDGYYVFGIRVYWNSSFPIRLHKLQACVKFGNRIFMKGIVTRHLDGNKLNNSWDNIAIGTQSDNMMDKPSLKRKRDASNPKYNHTAIIEDRAKGLTYKELMKKYNISSKGTLSFIINKSMAQEQ